MVVCFAGLAFSGLTAQDCDEPQQLCYDLYNNIVEGATSTMGMTGDFDCMSMTNAVMFEFETLSAGEFRIDIFAGNCNGDPSLGQSLEAAVFQAADPCTPASYVNTSCGFGDGITLLGMAVDSAEVFYVVVNGASDPGLTSPAECDFDIQIGGDAVDSGFDVLDTYLINAGQSVQLEASGAEEYVWAPANSLDSANIAMPTASPLATTDYLLTATIGTCELIKEVTVTVIPIIQPYNAFTPNDDSYNDRWRILNAEQFPTMDVRVFSRWGQQVFRSTGYGEGPQQWDGRNNGARLPSGTYYYVIELNEPGVENRVITGSVALIY